MQPWVSGGDIMRGAQTDLRLDWQWIICPACLCVSRVPRRDTPPLCPAPAEAVLQILRVRMVKVNGDLVEMVCHHAIWVTDLSPALAQTLESALILNGLRAVVDVINKFGPVEFGLDDPGGAKHQWCLARSRPKSIRRKRKITRSK